MPVLTFPCVIHRLGTDSRPTRRQVWIKGHDLRSLALVTSRRLGAQPDQCTYAMIAEETAFSGVVLQVVHASDDARVGPMAAPLPPSPAPAGDGSSLEDLLAMLNLSTRSHDLNAGHDERGFQHAVTVTYEPVSGRSGYPPLRRRHETEAQYRARVDTAERTRLERTRRQGVHVVTYAVPSDEWTAHDLEMLLVLAYRLLPTDEPRWRESGRIAQESFTDPRDARHIALGYALQVSRGDYVAHVRLPAFPTIALADWVASRRCEINLRQPVMKLEVIAQDWRCVDSLAHPGRAAAVNADASPSPA